ncbi:MAG: PEP/pyruvate-binding domain-containing protein [Rhodospirillales bacterium]|nr:PEP/pyruvate-binding domain-containing protein [Rhodospirillales bacterium]
MTNSWLRSLPELHDDHVESCGGKAANLGKLTKLGVNVPPGFCVLAEALTATLEENGLIAPIESATRQLDFDSFEAIEAGTAEIRGMIANALLPASLRDGIAAAYRDLVSSANPYVAVRSSVAVKDSAISSFPGMMDTYHYVVGEDDVLDKVRECWASLWSARAAYLRHHKRIPHHQNVIAPVIQLMVNPDTAGVLFTANPVTKDRGEIMIEANWGLGESVVSGRSMNDYFVIDKDGLGLRQRKIARKTLCVVMDDGRGSGRVERPVPPHLAEKPTLSDGQLRELAETGMRIERAYGFSVDVEWAYQGPTLFILQARKIRDLQD